MKRYKKLTPRERDGIAVKLAKGMSIRGIARDLNRSPSTISDEIHRSKDKREKEYIAIHAQYLADQRKKNSYKRLPLKNERVYGYVLEKLREGWSPEQISGRMRKDYPNDGSMRISWETIYSYIYLEKNRDLKLWEYLPWKRKRRRKKIGRKVHRGKIMGRISIHQRPKMAETREELGHWEGDTLEGKGHKESIHTEVERKSRYLIGRKIKRIESKETAGVQVKMFKEIPSEGRKTTTLDNGRENHSHMILRTLGMKTYFADTYSSWQRGSNEYHNGSLRRYFPKGTDFSKIEQKEIDDIIYEINNRPRKVLEFKTPLEVFIESLQSVRIIT